MKSAARISGDQVLARHAWLTGELGLRYVLAEKAYFLGDDLVVQAETMAGLANEIKFRVAVQHAVDALRDRATMTVIP